MQWQRDLVFELRMRIWEIGDVEPHVSVGGEHRQRFEVHVACDSPTGQSLTVRDPDGVHLSVDGGKLVAQKVLKEFWDK